MVDTEGDALEGIGRKVDLDGFDSILHVGVRNIPVVADALHRAERANAAEELFSSFEGASVKGVDFSSLSVGLRFLSDWQSLMVNLGLSKSVRRVLKSIDQLSATIEEPVVDMLLC